MMEEALVVADGLIRTYLLVKLFLLLLKESVIVLGKMHVVLTYTKYSQSPFLNILLTSVYLESLRLGRRSNCIFM